MKAIVKAGLILGIFFLLISMPWSSILPTEANIQKFVQDIMPLVSAENCTAEQIASNDTDDCMWDPGSGGGH